MSVQISCWKCGCAYHLPDELYAAAKRSENISFWCPYGHSAHYLAGETSEEKIRRERDRLKQQNAMLQQEAVDARILAEKAERATKRLKKRVAAGVCPCCHRTVSQMQQHMKSKHPGYVHDNVVPLKVKA